MNALVDISHEEERLQERKRQAERYERHGLEYELNLWGRWIESNSDHEGYPGMDILSGMLYGAGGGTSGHRILCLDMPTPVYAVHGRIIRLTEKYQEALYVRYAIRVRADGDIWDVDEVCRISGIEKESFYRRLRRAKSRLLGLDDAPIDPEDIE